MADRRENEQENEQEKGQQEKCSCWMVMRGDTAHPEGWETSEYELVPDPSCPVHGKKRHPLLDDEGGWTGGGSP